MLYFHLLHFHFFFDPLVKSMFNFHILVDFTVLLMLLNSSFNLLKLQLLLWPKTQFILDNNTHVLEENVQSATVGRKCYIYIHNWFKSPISLLHFCPVILYIIKSSVLKSPTIIIQMTISYFNSVNVCFIYFGAQMFSVYVFVIDISSW